MKEPVKLVLAALISLVVSTIVIAGIRVPVIGVGYELYSAWRNETGLQVDLNSSAVLYRQVVALALFLLVISFTVISPKYRYYMAFLSIAVLAITAIVPHSELVKSVDWRLILFLAGSMTLAYIFRSLHVFEFMLVELIRFTGGSFRLLVLILMFIAWFLALVLDEATNIVYVVMFVLELVKLGVRDVKPLIILSVLATNTGSMALPVGNPIGIYLAFTAKLPVSEFLTKALPLSAILLLLLAGLSLVLFKKYFDRCDAELSARATGVFVAHMKSKFVLPPRKLYIGILYMIVFLVLVASVDWLARSLSTLVESEVDAHTLLAFIPYLVIALTPITYDPEELERAILRGVEWPSLLFFVALFMLGDALKYTGVAYKLAYAVSQLAGCVVARTAITLLVFSALLSAFLDNLSIIVALTPVAKAYLTITGIDVFYWTLLYGGVVGGNFTPVGSTANIVAWSLAERRRVKVSWGLWLKMSLVITVVQLLVALIFVILVLRVI